MDILAFGLFVKGWEWWPSGGNCRVHEVQNYRIWYISLVFHNCLVPSTYRIMESMAQDNVKKIWNGPKSTKRRLLFCLFCKSCSIWKCLVNFECATSWKCMKALEDPILDSLMRIAFSFCRFRNWNTRLTLTHHGHSANTSQTPSPNHSVSKRYTRFLFVKNRTQIEAGK